MGRQGKTVSMSQEDIVIRINDLEQRVTMLEAELRGSKPAVKADIMDEMAEEEVELEFSGSTLESSFGEFGLAWLGNLVLLFGIVFLVKYLQNSGLPVISAVLGYLFVTALFLVSNYLKNTNKSMASVFSLNGYVLLFIVTMQLHFFSKAPMLTGLYPDLILLLVVSVIVGYMANRRKSERLAGLTFIMAAVTAVVSDHTHFLLPLTVLISIAAVYFIYRFGWWRLLIFSILLVYFINFVWLIGNPFMGHPVQVIKVHESGFVYIYFIAAAYSSIAMIRKKDLIPDQGAIFSIIMNGLGFSFLIALFVLAFFKDNYILLFGTIALFCIVYSIFLQYWSTWKVTASLYALYSFVALSVTVYGIYAFPKAYSLLAIQGYLVVIMAIWFRSRVIVVMNTFLFIILLIAYLTASHSSNSANIAFALVALATARTLNWQKENLKIKTELLLNTNLIVGFFMVLYALYRLVPGNYVTLSWTAAAALYFVLSFAMHNVKFRYLALGTTGATALYLFIVDLARVEIIYRVAAFLFLAMISIVLSLYYARRRKKRGEEQGSREAVKRG
jgi:hypothetical protein